MISKQLQIRLKKQVRQLEVSSRNFVFFQGKGWLSLGGVVCGSKSARGVSKKGTRLVSKKGRILKNEKKMFARQKKETFSRKVLRFTSLYSSRSFLKCVKSTRAFSGVASLGIFAMAPKREKPEGLLKKFRRLQRQAETLYVFNRKVFLFALCVFENLYAGKLPALLLVLPRLLFSVKGGFCKLFVPNSVSLNPKTRVKTCGRVGEKNLKRLSGKRNARKPLILKRGLKSTPS